MVFCGLQDRRRLPQLNPSPHLHVDAREAVAQPNGQLELGAGQRHQMEAHRHVCVCQDLEWGCRVHTGGGVKTCVTSAELNRGATRRTECTRLTKPARRVPSAQIMTCTIASVSWAAASMLPSLRLWADVWGPIDSERALSSTCQHAAPAKATTSTNASSLAQRRPNMAGWRTAFGSPAISFVESESDSTHQCQSATVFGQQVALELQRSGWW